MATIYGLGRNVEVNGLEAGPIAKIRPDGEFDRDFALRLINAFHRSWYFPQIMLKELPDGQYLMGSIYWQLLKVASDGSQVQDGSAFVDPGMDLLKKAYDQDQRSVFSKGISETTARLKAVRGLFLIGKAYTALELEDGSVVIGGDFVAKAGWKTWINFIKILPNGEPDLTFEVRTQ